MTPEPEDITARELAESVMEGWMREPIPVTPDPAPYGADLPPSRPDSDGTLGGRARDAKWREMHAALDAANAEVLALREVVEAVRALSVIVDPPLPSITMPAARRGDLMSGYRLAMELVAAILPAPTGDDG